jgi:hypothetical protein
MSRSRPIARFALVLISLCSLAFLPATHLALAVHAPAPLRDGFADHELAGEPIDANDTWTAGWGTGPVGGGMDLDVTMPHHFYLPIIGYKACGWPLPFEDTFTDNVDRGWEPVVGEWQIANDEVQLHSRDGVDEYTFIGAECWSEYILRVDLRYTEGALTNDYGIAFYVSPDHQSLYKLMINGGDLVRLLYVPNRARDEFQELDVAHSPIPFVEGRWYTLQAWVRQGRIQGSIDGITVIDVEDTRLTQGMIGLMSDGFPALLHYDNVKVY